MNIKSRLILLTLTPSMCLGSDDVSPLSEEVKDTVSRRMFSNRKKKDKLARYGKIPRSKILTIRDLKSGSSPLMKELKKLDKQLDDMLEEGNVDGSSLTQIEEDASGNESNELFVQNSPSFDDTEEANAKDKERADAIRYFRYHIMFQDFLIFLIFGSVVVFCMDIYKKMSSSSSTENG